MPVSKKYTADILWAAFFFLASTVITWWFINKGLLPVVNGVFKYLLHYYCSKKHGNLSVVLLLPVLQAPAFYCLIVY
jgi:hypothetical protein